MNQLVKVILILSLMPITPVAAQSLPTTFHPLEEIYRRAQLNGELDSSVSFAIRPLSPSAAFKSDSANIALSKWTTATEIQSANEKRILGLLPLTWKQQYNSRVPYGWNDGAMIPARGYQTLISPGVFARLGPLSIQLKPEFVFAENRDFERLELTFDDQVIDQPAIFGMGAYSQLGWGQTSIRLTAGPISLGLSNENLWWGPGIRNSILMGNSSRGFKHVTLNTVRPISTPVGSFEGQIIGGRLDGSEFTDPTLDKRDEWRYLSAVNLSYQPKWIPGLFFGLTRSFQAYHSDIKKLGDFIPLFTPYQKANTNDGDPFDRDQLTSVYSRWVFAKAKAELYFEYGVNDNAFNLRDFVMSPEHARAYIFGFRKLFPLNKSDAQVEIGAELTQLEQSIDRLVRGAGAYYWHGAVLHGYTHHGEVLGAGIGPGSNLQSLEVNWVRGIRKLGLQFERYVHNNDFYYIAIADLGGQSRRWVDFGLAAQGTWDYKNLLFNAKIQGIQSLNYLWKLENTQPDTFYIPQNDFLNFHGEIGITYRF